MAKFERFEEIKAWQLARDLVREIYPLTKEKDFNKDYSLRDQIRRSAVSIMSNIAEGFERYSKKEFVQFLNMARASSGETRSHLYVALDLNYITKEKFDQLKDLCEMISRHIWNLIKYLKLNTIHNV